MQELIIDNEATVFTKYKDNGKDLVDLSLKTVNGKEITLTFNANSLKYITQSLYNIGKTMQECTKPLIEVLIG